MAQRAQRARQAQPTQKIQQPAHMPQPALYKHAAHPHIPRSANERHAEERAQRASQSSLAACNERLAVFLTAYIGTMWTAYGFAALAAVGLLGVLAILSPSVYTLVAWLSQTFIQLVLLPVIMVGQNVLSRHAELQSDEQFKATLRTLHESEQMTRHLEAQDAELLRQTALIRQLVSTATPPAPTPAPPTPAPAPERPSHDRTDQHDSKHDKQPERPRRHAPVSRPVGGRGQLERLRSGGQ